MPFTRHLSDADIGAVYDAAIKLGLTSSRSVLLGSIPNNYGAGLEILAAPGAQLRSDLQAMNVVESLDDADRTIPLQRWLSTAHHLNRIRTEARVFQAALDKIAAAGKGSTPTKAGEQPSPTPLPARPWGPSLNGREIGELRDALLQAFPDRGSLAQMVFTGIDLRLDDVTSNSNLKNAVFDLLIYANAQGLIRQLFDAARIEAPGNPALLALVPKRGA